MSVNEEQLFGEWTPEAMDEAEAAAKGKSDTFQWPSGDTIFRVCPPAKGQVQAIVPVPEHWWDTHKDGEKKTAHVVCPGPGCPICAEVARLRASASEVDNDQAYRIAAKVMGYANAIIRGQEKLGVQVIKFSVGAFRDVAKLAKDAVGGGNFSNPGPDGFDLKLTKTGEKMATRYKVIGARRSSPLVNAELVAALEATDDKAALVAVAEQMRDLTTYALKTPVKKVHELWSGAAPAEGPAAAPASRQLPGNERVVTGERVPAATPSRSAQDDFNRPPPDEDVPF